MINAIEPLAISAPPKRRCEHLLSLGDAAPLYALMEGTAPARVLSLNGESLDCTVTHEGGMLVVEEERVIAAGMSGSPILAMDGTAIGAVSAGSLNFCSVQTSLAAAS